MESHCAVIQNIKKSVICLKQPYLKFSQYAFHSLLIVHLNGEFEQGATFTTSSAAHDDNFITISFQVYHLIYLSQQKSEQNQHIYIAITLEIQFPFSNLTILNGFMWFIYPYPLRSFHWHLP